MSEDDRGRPGNQGGFEHLSRVNYRLGQGADTGSVDVDRSVSDVEREHREVFPISVGEVLGEDSGSVVGGADVPAGYRAPPLFDEAASNLRNIGHVHGTALLPVAGQSEGVGEAFPPHTHILHHTGRNVNSCVVEELCRRTGEELRYRKAPVLGWGTKGISGMAKRTAGGAAAPSPAPAPSKGRRSCAYVDEGGRKCSGPATKASVYCRWHPPARLQALDNLSERVAEVSKATPIVRSHRSRYVAPSLLDDLARAMDDPGLLDLKWEISYVESRITELQQAFAEHQTTPVAWEKAKQLFEEATSGGSVNPQSLNELGTLIQDGYDQHKCQRAINDMIELRRRLLETQVKKMHTLDQFLPKSQAAQLGAALMIVFKKYILDRAKRELAMSEVAVIFRRPTK